MKTHKTFDRKNNIIFKDTKGSEFYLDGHNDWQTLKPIPKKMNNAEMSLYIDELIENIRTLSKKNTELMNECQSLKYSNPPEPLYHDYHKLSKSEDNELSNFGIAVFIILLIISIVRSILSIIFYIAGV